MGTQSFKPTYSQACKTICVQFAEHTIEPCNRYLCALLKKYLQDSHRSFVAITRVKLTILPINMPNSTQGAQAKYQSGPRYTVGITKGPIILCLCYLKFV